MTKAKPKTTQQDKWPPEPLKKYINNKFERDRQLGQAYKSALERLLDPTDVGLTSAYHRLCDKYDEQLISKYLEDVCDAFLDIEMYHPMREIDYKDWLRKISRTSVKLADTVHQVPSSDLTIPDGLSNVHSLLASLLEGWGDDITIEEYSSAGKTLRRSLQRIPISMLLRQLAVLADEEACNPIRNS